MNGDDAMFLSLILIFIFFLAMGFANLKLSFKNVKLLERLLLVPIVAIYSLLIKWNYINFTGAVILGLLIMNFAYFCSPFIQYLKDKNNTKIILNLIHYATFTIAFSFILLFLLFYCRLR